MKKISIVIITYNRPEDTLALLQNLAGLDDAETLLAEIILVNNASTVNYEMVDDFVRNATLPIQFLQAPENLGVTKGRNFGLQFVTGFYTVFLDDDAELQGTNSLKNICTAFEEIAFSNRPTALLSFKVLYYSNQALQHSAFPHKKVEKYKDRDSFATYYFAGGAHAIQTHILKDLGGLPANFFYGMEEYDISYQLIEKGYAIAYTNSVVMLHKESPHGRQPKAVQWQHMWVNKTTVAYKYLPWVYILSTAVCWGIQYLVKTKGNFGGFVQGWVSIAKRLRQEKRRPLSPSSLAYLKNSEARLWY